MILRVKQRKKQDQRLDHSPQSIQQALACSFLLTWMADWKYGRVFMVDIDID